MPTLFVFLFKVNMALLLFCAGYYLVLRHLTFYSLNRVYLITAIVFASIYPKIDLTAFAQRHENIALPVQSVMLTWQGPAAKLVKPLTQPDYWQWATLVFWAGAALLGIRLFVQLFSLLKLHRRSTSANVLNHEVRLISGEAAPFSFWRSIYVNPANHTPTDLKAILLHEQVHVNGWHTIDILLAELSSIFYWFNPGVWLMKKAVRENIEFITDRKILNKGIDTKAYQYSLVNVSFNATTPGIVNHFNISTIKKRIIMMNAKRSSRVNLTRYAFIVPAVALLLVFSFSNAAVVKKTSAKAYKAISTTIADNLNAIDSKISIADNEPVNAIKKSVALPKAKPATINKVDVVLSRISHMIVTSTFDMPNEKVQLFTDTNAKARITIATNNSGALDSLNYVLNGKKIGKDEFNKIDPNKIVAINIVSSEVAKTMLNDYAGMNFKPNSKILFVTTNDSEKGKELHDLLGSKITNIRITRKPSAFSGDIRELTADTAVTVIGYGGSTGGQVYTVNGRSTLALKKTDGETLAIVKALPGTTQSVNGVQIYTQKRGTDVATVKNIQARFAYTEGSVNRISDKLIVIDGKEASEKELKKLSAFDIDRMSTVSDADTIKKYGDKAKYGVVYIYTKKNK